MTLLHSPGDHSPEHPEVPARLLPVRHALRVLEAVAGHEGGVSEERLAAETGLPPAYLATLLWTLRREGYLDRPEDGTHVAGEALSRLGGAGARGTGGTRPGRVRGSGGGLGPALRERLRWTLARLRDSIGAAVYLGLYRDGEVEVVLCADSPRTPAIDEWVDFRAAGHATAVGKCLLGQLDHGARRDHLDRHPPARLTPRTITDTRVLLDLLDRQPPTVPVLDVQEYATDTVCAAVPVTVGSTVGSLALSLPVEHAHRLRRAAEALNEQAVRVVLPLTL
ncbi:IclR family transcriptional regulator [Streptomyces macrosporus]|uniref:IclR family transcriptional regulator C-terminal domain-containing protein n=1 Tax=Streptomyces macrosporus TaxID=44032 RepID=A0ABP5WPS8_9ACTN